jgi:hypothetical protein
MAGLDPELATLVKRQADWNVHMRVGLGADKYLLVAALLIEHWLNLTDPPASLSFALQASALGLGAALTILVGLANISQGTAVKADAMAGEYREATAGAGASGVLAGAEVVGAARCTVSSFEPIASSASCVPRAAGAVGEPAPRSVVTRAGDSLTDGTPVQPCTPGTPMSTLAPLVVLPGTAHRVSGPAVEQANPVNQAAGRLPRIASITPAAATDADEPPHVDGAGAAAAAGQPGPIEVAPVRSPIAVSNRT